MLAVQDHRADDRGGAVMRALTDWRPRRLRHRAGAAPIASAPPQDYLDTLSNTPGFTVNGFTGPYSLERGTQSARVQHRSSVGRAG